MSEQVTKGEVVYRTKDHPEANGRKAQIGEQQWVLTFPIDDGRTLRVLVGKAGHAALRGMLIQEMVDDEHDTGRH